MPGTCKLSHLNWSVAQRFGYMLACSGAQSREMAASKPKGKRQQPQAIKTEIKTETTPGCSNCFICNEEVLGLDASFMPLSISNGNALCELLRLLPPTRSLFEDGLILFCLSCGDQVLVISLYISHGQGRI